MKIDKNYPFKYAQFQRSEFACRCRCGFDVVDVQLLAVLQDIRDQFEVPVIISSGCRCQARNKSVGGEDHSQHLLGKAADHTPIGVDPAEVYEYLDKTYPDTFGIGLYDTFVHVDVREKKARWNQRAKWIS